MSQPPYPPGPPQWQPPIPQPRKSNTGLKIAGIGCGGILMVFIGLAALGAIIGPSKTSPSKAISAAPVNSAATTPAPLTTSTQPAVAPKATKSKKPASAASCGPGADLIQWSVAPGTRPIAGALGSYDSPECRREGRQSTLDMLRRTSPTGAGYCTLAAPASQNPGYEAKYVYGSASADPPRPKHVVLAVGSC